MNIFKELNIRIAIRLKSILKRITKVDTLLFCLSLIIVYTPIYLFKLEFNTILWIISIALAIAIAIIFSYIIDFIKATKKFFEDKAEERLYKKLTKKMTKVSVRGKN
jgi:ABC-type uncharacterized transport system permease subunit